MLTLEQRFSHWLRQPGTFVTDCEKAFVVRMRDAANCGVGYGWMQQVIEWEWQAYCEAHNLPGWAWGPEYFGKRIKELEAEVERLKGLDRQPCPDAQDYETQQAYREALEQWEGKP